MKKSINSRSGAVGTVWGYRWCVTVAPVCVLLEGPDEDGCLFAPVFSDVNLAMEGDEIARYRHGDGSLGEQCVVAHDLARKGYRLDMDDWCDCGTGSAGVLALSGERFQGPSSPEALEHRRDLDAGLACFLGQAQWIPTEEQLREQEEERRRKEELAVWKAGLRAKRLAREAEEARAADPP